MPPTTAAFPPPPADPPERRAEPADPARRATAPEVPPALQALVTRQSLGIKHLREPGPDDAALAWMVRAALAAPDHGLLTPFRFRAVRGAARQALADLFVDVARAAGKDEASLAIEAERALRAPVTVAVVARLDWGHPVVPAHEQWVAVGAALGQFLAAAHALGFAGKLLSGRKVREPRIVAAFCGPGETLVGWIALGTATRPPGPRPARPNADTVLDDWVPPAA
ncbi:nitroreductase family protein [Piscinibacter sakaiensis]|uniref:Nitroreductase domain-containing protein n=1 Tax=Piscinibacter sakaiensis TaxID=1547922 RepID=A0A0K8NTQ0_PISS1|nr:nitroreductase family protein [Piscinibacter sakaiensis]GAP33738.1 hypothetical protein ISF6_0993 [Piscinibacter sakaiensis]